MIWDAFSAAGMSSIEFINGTMNSVQYLKILENRFEPFIIAKHNCDCLFQQDNLTAHVAYHTMEYFTDLGCLF